MSERARGPMRRLIAAAGAVACAVALLALVPDAAGAQEVEAARLALVDLRARADEALRDFRALERARMAATDDSLRAAGRLVRFNAAALPASDRARLVAGLEAAESSLVLRFGTGAAMVADTSTWVLRNLRSMLPRAPVQLLAVTADGRNLGVTYRPPLDPDAVARLALIAAGAQAARRHPTLTWYAPTLSLDRSEDWFVRAARDLALSESSVSRRCAAGAIGACRTVLSPARGAAPLSVWYDRADHRAIVETARSARSVRARRDSTGVREREACLVGDDAICERIVTRLPLTYPFRAEVRGSFAQHALETGGAAGLARLDTARARFADDPVALLAYVAGQPEEALIGAWQRRLSAAAVADAHPPIAPLALSAAFWCALLLVGATRRRPR